MWVFKTTNNVRSCDKGKEEHSLHNITLNRSLTKVFSQYYYYACK